MLDRAELPATTAGSAQPPVAGLLGPPLAEGEARRIAAAQIDVLRARRARVELLAGKPRDCELAARLAAIDRYERRALSRRKRAIRHFDGSRK